MHADHHNGTEIPIIATKRNHNAKQAAQRLLERPKPSQMMQDHVRALSKSVIAARPPTSHVTGILHLLNASNIDNDCRAATLCNCQTCFILPIQEVHH